MESIDIIVRYVEGYGYLPLVIDRVTGEDLYAGEFRETPLIAFTHAATAASKYITPDTEEFQ